MKDDDFLHEMMRDYPCTCVNCECVAWVSRYLASGGKWTCYTCGRINRFPTQPLILSTPRPEDPQRRDP